MSDQKYKKALICLKEIRENIKENEIGMLPLLNGEKWPTITDEEAEPFHAYFKAIWVLELYNKDRYDQTLKDLPKSVNLKDIDKYVKRVIGEDGNEYLRYPFHVLKESIHIDIIDLLKEKYMIEADDLTESEWEKLSRTDEWIKCEKQVARKLIATSFYKKSKVKKATTEVQVN